MSEKFAKEVGTKEFSGIIAGERPVLVDFFATWCPPCKMMEPVVERLAERFDGRVDVIKVNVDEHPELAGQYGIRAVPTFLLFADGQPIQRGAGAMSERDLAEALEAQLVTA
jgi:thioredoxin